MKTIFAHTEMHNQNYPAYINVSENKSGIFTMIVRERGNNGAKQATIELNEGQVRQMALELLLRVAPEAEMAARLEIFMRESGESA